MTKGPVRQATPGTDSRSEATRERLLAAALDLFGRLGFEGVSTRMLAEAAGVNLQAINYHFGNKQGLYIATADHIVGLIEKQVGALRALTRQRFAELDAVGETLGDDEARRMLTLIVSTMMVVFLSDASGSWARFMVREQAEPTEAFERVYGGIMEPMLAVGCRLIGAITGEDADGEWVRLRTLALIGSVLVFRVGRATLHRQMQWDVVGLAETAAVRAMAFDIVASIRPREGVSS